MSLDIDFATTFVHNFFDGLDCFLELRIIKGETAKSEFYRLDKEEPNWNSIRDMNTDKHNIYFGVCGRKSKSGKAEAVNLVPALWVDIDNVSDSQYRDLISRIYDKDEMPIPSYIIWSGHGVHIYWLLKKPFKIDSSEDAKHIRGYLYGLTDLLHADHCHDLSRVMRLPETINWKHINAPVACYIDLDHWENYDIVRYPLSLFDKYWVEARQDKMESIPFAKEPLSPLDVSTLRVSDKIKKLITGPPSKGSRSEAVFAVVKSMQKAGYTPDEVLSVLMNNPIGDRYDER